MHTLPILAVIAVALAFLAGVGCMLAADMITGRPPRDS